MRLSFLFVAFLGIIVGAAAPAARAQSDAATAHGVVKWGGYIEVPTLSSRKLKVPGFSEAQLVLDDQVGWFSMRLNGAVRQGEFLNMVYEPFSAADAKLYNVSQLPAGPEAQLVTGIEMKQAVTFLRLRPVRRGPQSGQPERLVSFDYRYTPTGAGVAARGTASTRNYASHSVLQSGDWYKLGVAESGNSKSGIYKLDKAALLKLGLPAGLNPNNLHLYGNAMGILPQANAVYRPDDLAENNILFVGDNDAVLQDNEYFLFYSPGAHTWAAQGDMFRHRNNIYTDTAYYFVKVDARPGLRVTTKAAVPATGSPTSITNFTYRDFYEHDLVNLLHSGRNWVGEGFQVGGRQEFVLGGVSDLVANSPVRVTTNLLASSSIASAFQLTLNGQSLATQSIPARTGQQYTPDAIITSETNQVSLSAPGTELRLALTYNSSDPSASGYLDFFEINAERLLKLNGAQMEFRTLTNVGPRAQNRYVFAGLPTGAVVWDVTNPRHPQAMTFEAGSSSFIANADTVREFVALQPGGDFNDHPVRAFGKVANQDLHALNATAGAPMLDLVIVTHPAFMAQANQLAAHRTTHDGLKVAVVTPSQVYNEFGSGGQDVSAIRDFMKMLYDRAPAGKNMQLLLLGDASYDYKSDPYNDKTAEPKWWKDQRVPFKTDADFDAFNQNYVPTYESRESQAPYFSSGFYGQASYSSDDFYALLDDNEGEWDEQNIGSELFDIGVGRLPVRMPKGDLRNTTQAQQVVDKVIGYDATAAYGKWRNRITLVSDDGNNNIFIDSSIGSDGIANIIQTTAPVYNVHKVYLDLYAQQAVAAGQRSPDANRAIDQSVEQGSLIVNYLGHGGPKGLADEQIVTNASVLALRNPNNLTFFTTGTCDFSTYDNPDFTSAGEQSLTDNATGGAVGLFTTTRVVEAGLNAGLNQRYFNRVLQPINGKMPNIGTIVMMSKNDYQAGGINNRNYTLLADPSMTLAYPKQTVALDSVRQRVGKDWVNADTLHALARIRLHGQLLNNGTPNSTFTGRAQVTIYDKPTTVMTLGNEPGDIPSPVSIQESVIYGGQADVVNGKFSLVFVVPKDINYQVGMGKISLYASDGTHVVDANGYQPRLMGGAARNAPEDNQPPRISLFMDSRAFAFGGLTGQTTTLLADLADENGINTTGTGIGHDITAILDHDPNKLLVLNDSYVANVGDFTSGSVKNLFKDLSTGPHSLTVKAWDTYNNSSEKEIEFVVAQDVKLALDHVLNYPNPFAHSTTFFFDHNQAGSEPDNLDVQVQIFTVAGHLVRTLNAIVPSTVAHQQSITWNGRDDYDDQLARGVYVYRLTVRSQRNNSVASKYEKLVILN
ncbi:type IX secretion system sortase PorU [Hymenobacter negativus]|uniref:Type IX secretion system sortase PorU n=1 Tax=Hymenobacter negativus TaxID=2795026 RepID=A0ABS0QBS3_9BACT|nr:type IX secretion system sortase PorU [Hymenobacter negativus]MBH8560121.1 type IX secretion system sortase PorU [Hymenobacter negativus]